MRSFTVFRCPAHKTTLTTKVVLSQHSCRGSEEALARNLCWRYFPVILFASRAHRAPREKAWTFLSLACIWPRSARMQCRQRCLHLQPQGRVEAEEQSMPRPRWSRVIRDAICYTVDRFGSTILSPRHCGGLSWPETLLFGCIIKTGHSFLALRDLCPGLQNARCRVRLRSHRTSTWT